jgi:Peptidase of plants and bacteria
MIQTSARNSRAMLYKDPAEVPKYARKIEVVIDTNRENDVDGFVNRSASGSTVSLQARMFPDPSPATPNILVTLIVHEITHTTQGLNNQYGAFTEGIADYVLIRLWEHHDRKPGGTWLDGYGNAASFVIWLDTRYPDFVYRFNRLANRKRVRVFACGDFGEQVRQL